MFVLISQVQDAQGHGRARGHRRNGCVAPLPAALSPDLNPIELAFAKLKALLRNAATRTCEVPWQAIAQPSMPFRLRECADYFAHAGYLPLIGNRSSDGCFRYALGCQRNVLHRSQWQVVSQITYILAKFSGLRHRAPRAVPAGPGRQGATKTRARRGGRRSSVETFSALTGRPRQLLGLERTILDRRRHDRHVSKRPLLHQDRPELLHSSQQDGSVGEQNTVPHLHPSKAMKGSAVAGSLTTAGNPASAARDQRNGQIALKSTRHWSPAIVPVDQRKSYGVTSKVAITAVGHRPWRAHTSVRRSGPGVRRLGRGRGSRARRAMPSSSAWMRG